MSLELPLLPDPLYPQSAGQMPLTTMPVPITEPNGVSMPHIGSLPPFGSGSEVRSVQSTSRLTVRRRVDCTVLHAQDGSQLLL